MNLLRISAHYDAPLPNVVKPTNYCGLINSDSSAGPSNLGILNNIGLLTTQANAALKLVNFFNIFVIISARRIKARQYQERTLGCNQRLFYAG